MENEPIVLVRGEEPGDSAAIHSINEAAFKGTDEADLVDRLRNDGAVLVSLVAEVDKRLAGHILFSRMWIGGMTAWWGLRLWRRWRCCPAISGVESAHC